MSKNLYYKCVLISGLLTGCYCLPPVILYENSTCQNDNGVGICTKLNQCQTADDQVNQFGFHKYKRCSFAGNTEIVCCPVLPTLRSMNVTSFKRKAEEACEMYLEKFNNVVLHHIAGGLDATPGEFPFMAALAFHSEGEKVYYFRCGGSLISNKYVLTAAHCLSNKEEQKLTFVRLGVFDLPESVDAMNKTLDIKVKNSIINKKYKRVSGSDIALIELEKPVILRDDLRPACLYCNIDSYPKDFIITGWGATDDDRLRATTLQKGFVNFVPLQDCVAEYPTLYKNLSSIHLCAGNENSDSCVGDSGGPLLMRNANMPVVVGVISFGPTGCRTGRTSVYTSVAKHLDWIEQIVWK